VRRATAVTSARVGAGNARKMSAERHGDQTGDGFHPHAPLNVIHVIPRADDSFVTMQGFVVLSCGRRSTLGCFGGQCHLSAIDLTPPHCDLRSANVVVDS
jgi:hypothetical protein